MGTAVAPVRWRETSLAEERQRRQKAVDEFTRQVKDDLRPTCILLFGSAATGRDRIESDLGTVIIGGKLPEKMSDRPDHLAHLKHGIPVSIDVFPYTTAEFEQMLENKHITALECMHAGKPLYGEAYFKRLKLRFGEMVKAGLRRLDSAWVVRPEAP